MADICNVPFQGTLTRRLDIVAVVKFYNVSSTTELAALLCYFVRTQERAHYASAVVILAPRPIVRAIFRSLLATRSRVDVGFIVMLC